MRGMVATLVLWLGVTSTAMAQADGQLSPLMHARWVVSVILMVGLLIWFSKHKPAHEWAEAHTGWAICIILGAPALLAWILV